MTATVTSMHAYVELSPNTYAGCYHLYFLQVPRQDANLHRGWHEKFFHKKNNQKKHSKPLLSQETVKKWRKKRKRAEYKRIETRKRKGSVKWRKVTKKKEKRKVKWKKLPVRHRKVWFMGTICPNYSRTTLLSLLITHVCVYIYAEKKERSGRVFVYGGDQWFRRFK